MRSKYVVGLAGVAAVTLLSLIVPALMLSSTKYASWAAAVQAFGTVMAFASASAAFIWQRSQAEQREAEVFHDARSAQARLVSAWLETIDDGSDAGRLQVTIRNGSEMAINRVVANIIDGRGDFDESSASTPLGPATPDYQVLFEQVPPSLVAVGSVASWGGAMGWRPAIEIGFTDAANRHWIKVSHGPLTEIPQPIWKILDITFDWSWTGVLSAHTIKRL